MNNCLDRPGSFAPLLAALAMALSPFVATAAPTVSGIAVEQVDWLRPDGSVAAADSSWGRFSFDSAPDASATYYLNVSAANGSSSAWSVQNLPITTFVSGRQTVDLNLAELGVSAGTDLSSLQMAISIDSALRTVAPGGGVATYSVAGFQRKAWDEFSITGTFDPGTPRGIKLGAGLAGAAAADRAFNELEEDDFGCMPGSFARSLDWINRQYGRGSTKTVQDIYSDLATLIGTRRQPSQELRIERKAGYAQALLGVETKVFDAGNFLDPIFGVKETAPTGNTFDDFIAWLMREYEDGEDIEIAFQIQDVRTGKTGGHIVALVGLDRMADGKIMARYRDDSQQGMPGGDKEIKSVEIYELASGIAFGSARWTVMFAVSESIPEPAMLLLALTGLLALRLFSPALNRSMRSSHG